VFAIDGIPVSAARTVSGGSYVVLALFSALFLRAPLKLLEWMAVLLVTAGILVLGLQERGASSAALLLTPARAALAAACIGLCAAVLLLLLRPVGGARRALLKPLVAFAALSGLLSSVGDLCVKIVLSLLRAPAPSAGFALSLVCAGGVLIGSYLAGFYMLSRAYQAGSVVGGVVISDFFARLGAIFLGAVVLSEPLAGQGMGGLFRLAAFVAVLGGSVLLARFGDSGSQPRAVRQTPG
jgi:drug/metabolite transporter (DMT)-like permease